MSDLSSISDVSYLEYILPMPVESMSTHRIEVELIRIRDIQKMALDHLSAIRKESMKFDQGKAVMRLETIQKSLFDHTERLLLEQRRRHI